MHDGRDVLRRLVHQVSNPVRWDLCMQTMADLGVTAVIEIPPAGTLTGLAKRALPGVQTLAVKTPDDLEAAWALIEEHGTISHLDSNPTWRMLVAPGKGIFRRALDAQPGDALDASAIVGSVETLRGATPINAPHGGVVVEWLVHDGDPVSPGQPIIRLHPVSDHSVYA